MSKLDELPEEIYAAILEAIDANERKNSTLSLSRALPRSSVPRRWIYHHVVLKEPKSVLLLYRQLRKCGGRESKEANWIRALGSQSWKVDAQILADLVSLIPGLTDISLNVGPTFAPEHLDDIFKAPRPDLLSLELVFTPYVDTPTYYQFLKGSYFDSLLTHISSWPSNCRLAKLSIIQTLPPMLPPSHSFAQPIVFFSLGPLSTLCSASSLHNLTKLYLRIPSRRIVSYLVKPTPGLEQLRFLDISTTQVNTTDLSKLLGRFSGLIYLVLDQCGVVPRSAEIGDASEFVELGKQCALGGVVWAKAKEKSIKESIMLRQAALDALELTFASSEAEKLRQTSSNKVRKGRRGVATAAFSIRERPTPTTAPVDRSLLDPSKTEEEKASIRRLEKIRLLPGVPKLQSFCLTTFAVPTKVQQDKWKEDFTRGWEEGRRTAAAVQKRLLDSKRYNRIKLFRFQGAIDGVSNGQQKTAEEGLEDTKELEGLVEFDLESLEEILDLRDPPKLCFGAMEGIDHADGCAHSIS